MMRKKINLTVVPLKQVIEIIAPILKAKKKEKGGDSQVYSQKLNIQENKPSTY